MHERVRRLLDLGFSLDVRDDVEALLADERPQARVQGARALRQLGDARRSEALLRRWSRGDVDDPAMNLACARTLVGWRAHLGLAWMRRHPFPAGAAPDEQAEYLGCEATAAALLRDFTAAHERIDRALAMSPDNPWLHVEHAYVLERDDRHAEALAAVERALDLEPGYRTATQARARLLLVRGRRDE